MRWWAGRANLLISGLALLHCGDAYQIASENHLTAAQVGTFVAQGLSPSQTAYNGSMAELAGQRFMAFRVDAPAGGRRKMQQLALVAIDSNNEPLGPHQTLATPIGPTGRSTAEDPRLFAHDGGLYVVYSAHPIVGGSAQNRRLYVGRIVLTTGDEVPTGRLLWARQVVVDDAQFRLSKWEKNWTPFSHDGAIHLIYRTNPPLVLRVAPDELAASERQAADFPLPPEPAAMGQVADDDLVLRATPLPPPDAPPVFAAAGVWRGGTPALYAPELDEYVSFFHVRCRAEFNTGLGKRQYYLPGFYTFQARPPFAISRYVPAPLLVAERERHPAGWTRIVFPAGLIDDGDSYLVSYGQDDNSNNVARFSKQSLFGMLVGAQEQGVSRAGDGNDR